MSVVILTVGPQNIGKSTFCKKVLEMNPDTILISRDEILIEIFGSAYLNPYEGGHYIGYDIMWERIEEKLKTISGPLILDCWNGPDKERDKIINRLRALSVTTIGAWYFITPLPKCLAWVIERFEKEKDWRNEEWRETKRRIRTSSFTECYEFFYENANVGEGFDFVVRINPLEPQTQDVLFGKTSME